ncbi:MAG: hypothetical protein QW063_00240 [Candidatus Nanoarchaeia archaeon]
MAIEGTIFGLVLGLAAALVLLRYAGILHLVQKPAGFIAAGLMFYIIDLAWNAGAFAAKIATSTAAAWVTFAWELIAFILIVIGSLWAAADLMKG